MKPEKNKQTYKNAGVNIEAGNEFSNRIKKRLKSTHNIGTMGSIGAFSALFDPKPYNFTDPILVSATDGVGTKLILANEMNDHSSIGTDLVAMCVNDILCQGAKPLFFLDYLASGYLDIEKSSMIIDGIIKGCKESDCALIGGETAEMPGVYQSDDYDLAGFTVGIVERDQILPKNISEGNLLIGLKSSGFHSNGFSLIRNIIDTYKVDIHSKSPFSSKKLGEEILTPTKIYVKKILQIIEKNNILGISHITGGGLVENVLRSLPKGLSTQINLTMLKPQSIYYWMRKISDISDAEMLKTFNCGIGMVLVISEMDCPKVIKELKSLGENPKIIGTIIKAKKPKLVGNLF